MKTGLARSAASLAISSLLLLSACASTQGPSKEGQPPQPAPSPPSSTGQPGKPAQEIDRPVQIAGSSLRFSKMNPLYAVTDGQLQFYPMLWMGLGWQNAEGNMESWLAKNTTLSSDCSTVTIELYPEAKWSDGKPITAADVEFTYRLANHPKLTDPGLSSWVTEGTERIKGAKDFRGGSATSISGIKIVNDHKLELTLEPKDCRWDQNMHVLVNGIQPKHVLEPLWDQLDTHELMDRPDVTSGPYKLVKFELDQYAELERVDDWWGNGIHGQPKIKKYVVVQFTKGAAPRHAQLEARELHVGGVDGQEMARFEKMSHINLVRSPSVGTMLLLMNTRPSYMTPTVRQAIAHAIDFEGVFNVVNFGLGSRVATPIFGPDWAVDPNIKPHAYDPEKAKQLLKDANWNPNTKLVYLTTSAEDRLPPFIQQNLKDVGIQMEIEVASTQQRNDRWVKGEYDISGSGGGVLGLDPSVICGYFTPTSLHTSWTGWTNQRFYDLCAEINTTTNQSARQSASYQLQRLLYDELPWINYGRLESVFAVDARLGGFEPNVVSTNRSAITLMKWYWKE